MTAEQRGISVTAELTDMATSAALKAGQRLRLFQVDSFAEKAFSGNPAAVVPLASWVSDDLLQNIAMENNLSETAFFVPMSEAGVYHIRWFTPLSEVDLCGHATMASGHVIFNELGYPGRSITFQSKSGSLGVSIDENKKLLSLDFPADVVRPLSPAAPSKEDIEDIIGVPSVECVQGVSDLLVIVNGEDLVRDLSPDLNRIAAFDESIRGIVVSSRGENCDFVSRCFFPRIGIPEDPVTGSSHCLSAMYWRNIFDQDILVAEQLSARGGKLLCRVPIQENRVHLSGSCVTYLEGTLKGLNP